MAANRPNNPFERELANARTSSDPTLAMSMMATITGGRYLNTTNDPGDALRRAALDQQGSYTAAFYIDEKLDGRWHNLKLKSTRPGVTLTYREGYWAEEKAPGPAEWTQDVWREAMTASLGASAVRMMVQINWKSPAELSLEAKIDPTTLSFLPAKKGLKADFDIAVGELLSDGQNSFRVESSHLEVSTAEVRALHEKGIDYTRR
jgi:hypothetical protein